MSYHGPAFFLEVLPRKNRIGLVLPLDFNEIEDRSGVAEDTSQWKFIVNAAYEGGVYVSVRSEGDIDKALPYDPYGTGGRENLKFGARS